MNSTGEEEEEEEEEEEVVVEEEEEEEVEKDEIAVEVERRREAGELLQLLRWRAKDEEREETPVIRQVETTASNM